MTSRFDNIVVAMGEKMTQPDKIIDLVTEDIGKHRRKKEEKDKKELAKLLEKRVEFEYDIYDEDVNYVCISSKFTYYIGINKILSFKMTCFTFEVSQLDLFIQNIENKKQDSLCLGPDDDEQFKIKSLGLDCDELEFEFESSYIEIIIPTNIWLKHLITIRDLLKKLIQKINEQNE